MDRIRARISKMGFVLFSSVLIVSLTAGAALAGAQGDPNGAAVFAPEP